MGGPWEDYAPKAAAPQAAGPWADYQPAASAAKPAPARAAVPASKKAKTNAFQDVLQNLGSGAIEGVRDLSAEGLKHNAVTGAVTGRFNPHEALAGAAAFADQHHLPAIIGNGLRLIDLGVSGPVGQAPQTTAGRYARTIGQMLPNAVGGGEGIAARAGQVLLPAAASETLGHAAQGTKYEGAARMAGALIGGVASGVRAPARGATRPPPHAPTNALQDYARTGVDPVLAVDGGKGAQMAGQHLAGNAMLGGALRRAATTRAAQVASKVDQAAGKYGSSASTIQAGHALKTGVEEGVGRLKAEAGTKYDALKPLEADPTPRPLTKSRQSLDEAFAGFTTPELKGYLATKATDLAQIRDVLSKAPGASYAEMKAMRGVVGGMMDDPTLISSGQNAGLKRLYGAMTEDMHAAADSKGLGGALKAADANYAALKAKQKVVFNRFFGPNVTEQAAFERMTAMAKTKGAKASWPQLRTLRQAVGDEQWGEVSSGYLRNMGKVAKEGGEEGFSSAKFATEWNNMAPQARQVLFGGKGRASDFADLQALARIAQRDQAAGKFYNHSQSGNAAGNIATIGAHVSTATAALMHQPAALVGLAALDGVGMGASKLLSSPGFARIVLRANSVKSPASRVSVNQQLAAYARRNPAVSRQVFDYQRALASAVGAGAITSASATEPQQ